MSKIMFSIQYAGLQLQIAKNDKGEDVTPLKPISDLFGLSWSDQYKKINGDFYRSYLGVCIENIPYAGTEKRQENGQKREQICILVSRVAAFLMSISPERVRVNGNITGAQHLEAKLNEWADALHDYEEVGVAVNKNHIDAARLELSRINSFTRLVRKKRNTESASDRKAIESVQAVLAKQIGIPYQPDLTE